MAAVSAHAGVVRGKVAAPGCLPPAKPLPERPATPQPQDPVVPQEQSQSRPASVGGPVNPRVQNVIYDAMAMHYRDQMSDSKLDYSPAWKQAKVSIRFLNHLSPLILGIIQRPGSSADPSARKEALSFLTASTDALAAVMAKRLAPNQDVGLYERLELNSMLAHMVGLMWEKSAHDDPQKSIDELVKTVDSLYADQGFLTTHTQLAEELMRFAGYRAVDCKETMESRLRHSMHLAALRFYDGVTDERVCSRGTPFTYGQARTQVVAQMMEGFDATMKDLIGQTVFSEMLSNDQRTSLLQSWVRNASDIFRSEYVAQTGRLMQWFQEKPDEFKDRFAKAKTMLPDVLLGTRKVTLQTMQDLIAIAEYQSVAERDGQSSAPAPR